MANNLAKFRGKHGLTQEQLGEKLGISKAGVSHLEKNKICPETAQKCADILGENVFDILGTDALKAIPQTEEDKNILIDIIRSLWLPKNNYKSKSMI